MVVEDKGDLGERAFSQKRKSPWPLFVSGVAISGIAGLSPCFEVCGKFTVLDRVKKGERMVFHQPFDVLRSFGESMLLGLFSLPSDPERVFLDNICRSSSSKIAPVPILSFLGRAKRISSSSSSAKIVPTDSLPAFWLFRIDDDI
jgi:hypothetical protein